MNFLRAIPIKSKLILMGMSISVVALLLAMLAVTGYETLAVRRQTVRELSALTEVLAVNSRAALAFHDAKDAQETLQGLDAHPAIVEARLYDRAGNIFAAYLHAGPRPQSAPALTGAGHHFAGRDLWVVAPVVLDNEQLGLVALCSDLREHRNRLKAGVAIFVMVLVAAALVAWWLANWWQRLISQPILQLARVAGQVTQRQDYSLRADRDSDDEIGELVSAFNQMLTQIQAGDASLRQSEERFRQLTESIREVFWLTDVTKQQMIYISPGYEEIWGRPVNSLYLNPRSWIDTIHPADRDRVTAALPKQAGGDYDEEYRIVRPDGAVRWIQDRAFPIRNEAGAVYRVAGIAEDITERKQLERRLLEVSDQEQQRIGQDLHDGLCQHLAATKFASQVLEDKLTKSAPAEAADARRVSELINQAIIQARDVARGLSPVAPDAEGLNHALESLVNSVERIFQISCVFDCPGAIVPLPLDVATHLYRITQEAIHNALRHAQASQIVVTLAEGAAGQLILTIRDDGAGLPQPPPAGMGLQTMRYRAGLIGATLTVETRPQTGVSVICAWRPPAVTT